MFILFSLLTLSVSVCAHTVEVCWEHGNGVLTLYAATYHDSTLSGGVILNNVRQDFTSKISKDDFNLLEIGNCYKCPTYSGTILWYQTLLVPITPGTYIVEITDDDAIEIPWSNCNFPDIEIVDNCDNTEDVCGREGSPHGNNTRPYIPTGPFAKNCNCTHYYICGHQGRVEQPCPIGTVFNSITNYCDWPENVPECSENVLCTPEQLLLNTTFPNEEDCTSFHRCVNEDVKPNHLETLYCDEGLVFDPNLLFCNYPELVSGNCGTKIDVINPCNNIPSSNHIFEINCTHYYKCGFDGSYTEFSCPVGLVVNEQNQYCDWIYNVPKCNTCDELCEECNLYCKQEIGCDGDEDCDFCVKDCIEYGGFF